MMHVLDRNVESGIRHRQNTTADISNASPLLLLQPFARTLIGSPVISRMQKLSKK
jgi:hypothetical protein